MCKVTDLRRKEVINICDGCRLGFVCDVQIQLTDGKVVAIIVPGPFRWFGLLGRWDDYVIPWKDIKKIGDDIILVSLEAYPGRKNPRKSWRYERNG